MADPSADQKYRAMVTAGVDPAEAHALAYGGAGKAAGDDPLAFSGWGGTLTGAPGAYSYGALTGHPGAGAAGQDFMRYTAGGQEDTRAPVTPASSDMIFRFQEALLSGQPWAMRTKADMVAAGLIPATADPGSVIGAYAQMVKLSAGALSKNQYKTPQDYIDQWKAMTTHDQTAPVTTVATSTSRTIHRAGELAAAYQGTATNALGRRATPAEAAAAAAPVKAAADASPSTSTTTTVTAGRRQRSSTVTTPGMSGAEIDEQLLAHAMQNPEYGAYQAAGRYFPVLEQALQAITGAGT